MKYIISKNIIFSMLAILVVGVATHAFADDVVVEVAGVDVEMVNKLSATVKKLLNGKISLVVDGIIIVISAYAAAVMRTPAPLIFGIISCALFHMALKILV